MRTVEKRCEMSSAILPSVSSAKRSKTSQFTAGIERGGGLVENEQLRVAKIGARQGELLPFAAGEIDAALEAAAQHLVVAALQLCDHAGGQALLGRVFDFFRRVRNFDAAHGDVFARRHFVAHEVLKDDADLGVQVGQVVLAQIDAIEQDLAFGGIVEPRDELDDGGLALAVFADQGDALAGLRVKLKLLRTRRLVPG